MSTPLPPAAEHLLDGLESLPSWEERYRALIDLGRKETGLPEEDKLEEHRVEGCVSQVWVIGERPAPGVVRFRGDSDSFIVKGLLALLLRLYNDQPADQVATTDSRAVFARAGLDQHLTPLRSNGLASMDRWMRTFAASA